MDVNRETASNEFPVGDFLRSPCVSFLVDSQCICSSVIKCILHEPGFPLFLCVYHYAFKSLCILPSSLAFNLRFAYATQCFSPINSRWVPVCVPTAFALHVFTHPLQRKFLGWFLRVFSRAFFHVSPSSSRVFIFRLRCVVHAFDSLCVPFSFPICCISQRFPGLSFTIPAHLCVFSVFLVVR